MDSGLEGTIEKQEQDIQDLSDRIRANDANYKACLESIKEVKLAFVN